MLGDGRVSPEARPSLAASGSSQRAAAAMMRAGAARLGRARSDGRSHERTTERCDAANASLVVDSLGIGPVLRGARIAALARRCTVSDTTLTSAEGTPERAHVVTLRGHTVVVLIDGHARYIDHSRA